MRATYRPLFVALTFLVGASAAFVAAQLYAHAASAEGRPRTLWLAGAAACGALAMWGAHLVGLLTLRLQLGGARVPIDYDIPTLSLPVAVAAAAVGLATALVVRAGGGSVARTAAGLLLGAGIAGSHYAALSAMRVPATLRYEPDLVGAAVLVAVAGAIAVTTLALRDRADRDGRRLPRSLGVAGLAAATITGTHYTALAGIRFVPTGSAPTVGPGDLLATDGLAVLVAVVVLVTLGLALLVLSADRRAREQRRVAEHVSRLYRDAEAARVAAAESERRFRTLADTGPAMVWLAGPDGRRTFVGQKWREFTGRPGTAPGDDWVDAIDPEDRGRCLAAYHDALAARRHVRLEYRVRRPDGSRCWVLDAGIPRETAAGEPAGYVGTCIDISDRREAEEAQAFLLEVARVLATSLEVDAVVHYMTDLLVPRLADFCVVYLRDADGAYRQAAAAHRDPSLVPTLEGLGRRYRPDVDNPHSAVGRAVHTAAPVLVPEPSADAAGTLTADPEARRMLEALAPTAHLVVPLVARRELLGTVSLIMSTPGRSFTDRDRALAELFAARAALALDNARLYTEARRARDEGMRASQLESQLMRTRLEALRAQLNPHFLFNALNTIAMLVRRQARDDALRGIVSLSDLLRRSLDEQSAQLVPLRAELPAVESYVAIERLRFRDRLRVRLDVAPETIDALVPGLLLQPLVENAIKHGVARRGDGGTVEVRSRREADMLVLEVADDGPGFPGGWGPASSGGIGLANTRERLERLYDGAYRFDAGAREGGGARVTIRIPFRLATR